MPIETDYRCEVCNKSVNDLDLKADPTLRRILAGGTFVRVLDGVTVESTGVRTQVFCGYPHASEWAAAQTW